MGSDILNIIVVGLLIYSNGFLAIVNVWVVEKVEIYYEYVRSMCFIFRRNV